ncbi:gluconate 2-dehydrogenase subunit 3 family protein [Chitinophaga niabensis]|uniref:gluconate 2-dehydrogenase subunit 3 family protein n=1 Tax=Chitinophaga niabensis TaxID=536979 RepID=UPI0031BA8FD6
MDKLIKRRAAIRNLLIIAGGAMVLPACYRNSGKASIALQNLTISEDEENLLAELTETLIPETTTPGAKSLKLHLFVLKMVDDCYTADNQKLFVEGLKGFNDHFSKQAGTSFADASPEKRQEVLKSIQDIKQKDDPVKKFYDITKSKTIQGYLSSKYVMTNIVKYELVPGRYNGYFPA